MGVSSLHHFVPKFVLREFAGQGGHNTLLRLRLSSGVIEPRNLDKQTAMRGHNALHRPDGSADESWERAFSALESEIAPAARAVAQGQLVGLQAIALLLMLQVARTPVGRQATADEAHWRALYENVEHLRDRLPGELSALVGDLDAGPARELIGVALSCLQAPCLWRTALGSSSPRRTSARLSF